jgi:hypothetical protein
LQARTAFPTIVGQVFQPDEAPTIVGQAFQPDEVAVRLESLTYGCDPTVAGVGVVPMA